MKNNKMGKIIKTMIFAFILQLSFFITSVNAEIINIGDSESFDYTGDVQEFTAPKGGIYKIELWGASGSDGHSEWNKVGGKGAYTSGNIKLKKSQKLYFYVGEAGTRASISKAYGTYTFNGASGGNYTCYDYQNGSAANNNTGGSATDVRLVSGNWDNSESLASRIMVAAGGSSANEEQSGVAGGALNGFSGGHGNGATQTSAGGPRSGSFGKAGIPVYGGGRCDASNSMGASSGYYGGGAYDQDKSHNGQAAAGSGSSYISGYTGCVAIKSQTDITPKTGCANGTTDVTCSYHYSGKIFEEPTMIAGNASMPTHDGTGTMTGNTGAGYAKITYLEFKKSDATLSSLTITGKELTPTFDSETTEYNLELTSEEDSIEINAVPTDEDATASYNQTVTNISYGTQTQEVIVTAQDGTINVYTITINKRLSENENIGFDYTGTEETFTAADTGLYKLETWGASGNLPESSNITRYSYGGYSEGIISLTEGDTLYINVGGQGESATKTTATGGYNGGGSGKDYSDGRGTGSGGGATHIALSSGLLNTLSSKIEDIIIVSGAGGGVGNHTGVLTAQIQGGSGGGINGVNGISDSYIGYGGTQTSGGNVTSNSGSENYTGTTGSFGTGGNCSSTIGNCTGGGAGFYGGGSGSNYSGAGGGGSGYIGNSLLISDDNTTKHMACYNCTTSDSESTKTISNTCHNETPTEDCAKEGNGYAKITFIRTMSDDATLKSLSVKNYNFTQAFDSNVTEYNLVLGEDTNKIEITAEANNEFATVSYSKTVNVPFGNSVQEILVTAENGGTKIYTINITKESEIDVETGFDYTGDVQTFVAPKTGTYKLETWGAQGYGNKINYGGYSTGLIKLEKDDEIYIVVGSAPLSRTVGGYNGGGNAGNSGSPGGGATHISYSTGLLRNLNSDKDSILIVSGGGGGSDGGSGGGAGGGLKGNKGSDAPEYGSDYLGGNGGTQTGSGTGGGFGYGGSAASQNDDYGSAGGGGYYGGGRSSAGAASGGGGSGYIGSTSLLSDDITTKHMTCYNCTTSDDESTKTISNTCYNETATSDCSKVGNGYAKVTFVESKLVNDITVENQTIEPTFDEEISDYRVIADKNTESVLINVNVTENVLSVTGDGSHQLSSGKNEFEIIVTSNSGSIEVYKVEVLKEVTIPTNSDCNDVTYNEQEQSLIDSDSAYNFSTNDKDLNANLETNAGTYDMTVSLYEGYVWSDGTKDNKNVACSMKKLNPVITTDKEIISIMNRKTDSFNVNANMNGSYKITSNVADVSQAITGEVEANTNNKVTVTGVKDGTSTVKIVFTPTNTTNYNVVEKNINITVENNPDVHEDVIEPAAYDPYNFGCTNSIQEFTAPVKGKYKLEVWGAQGTTKNSSLGVGGYSVGNINMASGDTIYVVVGCRGSVNSGGYNGGGNGASSSAESGAGGGGATHISRTDTLLRNTPVSDLLIAAGGGGGGAGNYSGGGGDGGGAGGGYKGQTPTGTIKVNSGGSIHNITTAFGSGGSQTSGGSCGYYGSLGTDCSSQSGYGYGASANSSAGQARGGGGGGGGFYGGGAGYSFSTKIASIGGSGGGGSGYIGNSALTEKHMACVNCESSDSVDTKTINLGSATASDSAVTDKAKKGNGAARITILEDYSEPQLKSLKVNGEYIDETILSEPGDETVFNVTLNKYEREVTVTPEATSKSATIAYQKDIKTPAGETVTFINVTNQAGEVKVYRINFYRPANEISYATDLTYNGTTIPGFDKDTLEYTINQDSFNETKSFEIGATLYSEDQLITGLGTYNYEFGTHDYEVTVTSEDRNATRTYIIHMVKPHTTRLKILELDNHSLSPSFNKDTFTYGTTIGKIESSVGIKRMIPYDDSVEINSTGHKFIRFDQNGVITVTVTHPDVDTTTYVINAHRDGLVDNGKWGFSCKGSSETWTVPETRYYILETWGAQGGKSGGKGGYTRSKVKLTAGQKIYVTVGCKGGNASNGGYNGGGAGTNGALGTPDGGSGGGATHMAINSNLGELKNFNNKKSDVLLVAGGGGGGNFDGDRGGAGGGQRGIDGDDNMSGTGGGQSGGGSGKGWIITGGNGKFGSGGSASSISTSFILLFPLPKYSAGGGGGGWYGGGGGDTSLLKNSGGGGGGSGHINTESGLKTKDTTTIDGNSSMPDYRGGYTVGKSGDGFATIQQAEFPSDNNNLKRLSILATDEITLDETKKDYTPELDDEATDYYVHLESNETKVDIDAEVQDGDAEIISGLGTYIIDGTEKTVTIVVKADNDDVKEYKIHFDRELDTNSKALNIRIEGLVPNLCNQSDIYCNLEPEFDPETGYYEMLIPGKIDTLNFVVEKAHKYQTVTGDGSVFLSEEHNFINIRVTSEDGQSYTDYQYKISRDLDGSPYLETINVLDPDIDLGYSKNVFNYYITVPNDYDKYVDNGVNEKNDSLEHTLQLYVKPEGEHTTYTISGDGNLKFGNNSIDVISTARNGEVLVYNIVVYRAKDISTLLSSLEVYDDSNNKVDLVPDYNKLKYSYRGEVDNTVNSIRIVATPEDSRSTVSGDGEHTLSAGKNTFPVTITSPAGDIEAYTIIITKAKENNNYLSSLVVKNGEEELTYEPEFNKETYEYNLEVDYDVDKLDIIGTPESEKARVINLYDTVIKTGNNKKTIYVYAEDGTKKEYVVNIFKKNDLENRLSDLKIYDKDDNELTYEPEFNKETFAYTLEVENEIDTVRLEGTKINPKSVLNGNGTYALQVGMNPLHIELLMEGQEPVSYTVLVTRKGSANAYLQNITVSDGTLAPEFNKETLEYVVNVNSDIETITIDSEPEVISTTVTGNGKKELTTGDNNFELVTMAEDGETSLTYKLKVVKPESDNNNIKSLILEEGGLTPTFEPSVTSYSADVPYEVTSGTFRVELEDEKATYEILNNENFVEGENEVTIRVTSESGKTKDYVVTINRQQESTSNYLASLSVTEGTLTPVFDKHVQFYEVEVESDIESLIIEAEPEYASSTVTGTGLKVLSKGKNLYVVRVTDKNNVIRDYQVLVNRKGNNEARLKTLEMTSEILSPAFDKDTYSYSTSTANTSLVFKTIEPLDENATYIIKNNSFVDVGDYTVTIEVTAEDKVTKKEYNITVTKRQSDNTNLSYLGVEGYSIVPEFDKTINMYTLTVPSDVNAVNIIAKAEDPNATINGTGVTSLVVGENNKFVTVTSESGNTKTYTIKITREGSSNNRLKTLDVLNGTISPTYSNDIYEYDVEIPYEENIADLYYELEDENSKVTIIGNEDLQPGLNEVVMTVTSTNGDVRIINLHVTKIPPVSSLLKLLKVNGYEISPEFNSYQMNYEVDVNNETESLDMVIEPLDPNATYVVRGNTLEVGDNEVTIEVTASDGVTKSTYTINVTRDAYANNFLMYLFTNRGDLTPTFSATTNEYSIDVANDIEDIDIIAKQENSLATITTPNPTINTDTYDGLVGRFALETGENKIHVLVTTEDGHTRRYIITVNRAGNSDNYLKTLKVYNAGLSYDLVPEFVKETTSYRVNVPSNVEDVVITGTPHNPTSTVTGLGEKQVNFGDNTFPVVVTAEDGSTRTYTIVITRALSSINNLFLLEPSSGELEPEFDGDTTEYDLVLDESVSTLWFDYIAEDKYSVVEGTEEQVVPDGRSVREIVVTAENGDTKTYTVNVIKQRKDNALLSDLYVIDYPFVNDQGEEVTFDKDTYDYYIKVPYSKAALNPSEVVYETEDERAVVQKDGTMNLLTTNDNIYKVKVTAQDGFTTNIYSIHVEREKNNNALLNSFEAKVGNLNKEFIPTDFEYVWTLDENKEITPLDVTYTLMDENATATPTESVTYVEGEDNAFEIEVTSEDGTVTNTYRFVLELNTNEKPYLKSLTASVGTLEPEFNKEINTYDLYEYDDVESVTISAEPEDPTSTVTGTGEVTLTSEFTRREITVTGTNGETNVYVVNIHKVVPKDDHLENLGLNGLDGLNCVNNMCTLTPTFDPEETSYEIKVPYEYDKLDVYYKLNNEHQHVEITVDGNEYVKGMNLGIGETEVTVKVYNGLNELTNTYTMTVNRLENVTIITPDGPIDYPKGEDYELPTNTTPKDSEDGAAVTFKLHNGEDDIVKHVTKNYTPNGWLVNDIHYDDKAVIKVDDDITLVPDYIETLGGVEFPSDPRKENYAFTGWFDEETGGTEYTSYNENEEFTLHAQYTDDYVVITIPDEDPIPVPKGEEFELPTNDKDKDDKTYIALFKYHNGDPDTTSEISVHYEPNGWLINGVHYDDGAIITPEEDITLVPDYTSTVEGATFPSDPIKENNEFIGWYDNEAGGNKYTSYNEEADIILHARWNHETITITTPEEDIDVPKGEDYELPTNNTPKASEELATVTFKPHNGEEDIIRKVTKKYTPNGWLINGVHYDDGAIITPEENIELVPDYTEEIIGAKFPLNPTKTNQKFNGWYTEKTGGEKVDDYSELQDITLHAQYIAAKEAYLIDGPTINSYLKWKVQIYNEVTNYSASNFYRASLDDYNNAVSAAEDIKVISTDDSPYPVYLWLPKSQYLGDPKNAYYYTEANIIYLNENSSNMFYFTSIHNLEMDDFDTRYVTNMSGMFNSSNYIQSIDVTNFDTSNVTDMSNMFGVISAEVDLSNFDTSNVTNMASMFFAYKHNLDLSSFDTSKVTNMSSMFNSCYFEELDISNFNTSNVTDMTGMFQSSKLKSIDVSNFDVSNVDYYMYMFKGMSNIEELDLSAWKTKSTGSSIFYYDMFNNMPNLKTIYVTKDDWKIYTSSYSTSHTTMFNGDVNLVGGQGTAYDSSHKDSRYAIVDEPDIGKPGYLTDITYKNLTHTVTFPDGTVEVYKHGSKVDLSKIHTESDSTTYGTITFKPHNGEDDTTLTRVINKTPKGFLVNDVEFETNEQVIVNEDKVIEYNNDETITGGDWPEAPTREGYDFLGWYTKEIGGEKVEDYTGLSPITLHAQWDSSLPTDIELDAEDITIVVGETHQIEVTFIPDGTTDTVTYTGFDNEKISVTEEGLVTGLEAGTTEITVGLENASDVTKTITVTVINNKITSQVLDVKDKTKARIIIGEEPNTSINDFLDKIDNPKEYLVVYDKDGNQIDKDEFDSTIVTTGMKVKLVINGIEHDEVIAIIRGDLNEDGRVNVMDLSKVSDHILEKELIEGYKLYAADLVEDEEAPEDEYMINVMDQGKFVQYILENIDSLNE